MLGSKGVHKLNNNHPSNKQTTSPTELGIKWELDLASEIEACQVHYGLEVIQEQPNRLSGE